MLWHERAGPVAAASMNEYRLLEGGNMQTAWAEEDRYCLTPRLELRGAGDGPVFSNVYDPTTDVRVVCAGGTASSGQAVEIRVQGRLVDHRGQDPPAGPLAFTLAYRFDDRSLIVEASLPDGAPAGVVLHFPLIAEAAEPATWVGRCLEVRREGGTTLRLSPSTEPDSQETERLFNFVPGFEAVPVRLPVPAGGTVRIRIAVD